MRIRNLSTFIKVARLGSFRAASSQLHVSQPAISARINALEDELGISLFKRGKSGTQLTDKGKKILVFAEKLLAISEEMKVEAGYKQQHKGSFKIGIADTLAHLWLSPLLKQWQRAHPQISFELISDVTPVLIKQLENHQIDLALMVEEQTASSALISQPLCSYAQVWVIGSQVDLKHTNLSDINEEEIQIPISDMAEWPILSFPRDTRPWHYLQQLFKKEDLETVIHTTSSVASLISLIEQGLGIALLPLPLVRSQIETQQLKQFNSEIEPLNLDFCCSWRKGEENVLPSMLAESARKIMQTAL